MDSKDSNVKSERIENKPGAAQPQVRSEVSSTNNTDKDKSPFKESVHAQNLPHTATDPGLVKEQRRVKKGEFLAAVEKILKDGGMDSSSTMKSLQAIDSLMGTIVWSD